MNKLISSIIDDKAVVDYLYSLGIYTVSDLIHTYLTDPTPLKKNRLIWNKIQEIVEKLQSEEAGLADFVDAVEVLRESESVPRVSTGSKTLDSYIDQTKGLGVPIGTSIEFYGEASSGKSEFLVTMAAKAFAPTECGGLTDDKPPNVYVIDTESTWTAGVGLRKVLYIVKHRIGLQPESVVSHIKVASAVTVEDLNALLLRVINKQIERGPFLLVIDSLSAPFRLELGYDNLRERNILYSNVLRRLKRVMQIGGVVAFSNQVYQSMGYVAQKVPYGGEKVKHFASYRVQLSRAGKSGKYSVRKVKLVDVIGAPEEEFQVVISPYGIVDASRVKSMKLPEPCEQH